MKKLKYTLVLTVLLLLSCIVVSAKTESQLLHDLNFVPQTVMTESERELTRGEFAYIISRMFTDEELAPCKTSFTDVSEEHAYSGYISFAVENGMMSADEDSAFHPDGTVTVYEILKAYYDKMGMSTLAQRMGEYPQGYYNLAVKHSILSGVKIEESIKNKDAVKLISNIVDAEVGEIKAIYVNDGVKLHMTNKKISMLEEAYGITKLKANVKEIRKNSAVYFDVTKGSATNKDYVEENSYLLPFENVDMKEYKYTSGYIYIKEDIVVGFSPDANIEVISAYIYSVNDDMDETHKYRPDMITDIELYDGEEYMVENLSVELNNQRTLQPLTVAGRFARIIIRNNVITHIETWDLTEGGLISGSANGGLQYTQGTTSGMNTVKFRNFDNISVIIDGRYAAYSDIKADSVFDYYADNGENAVLIISEKAITDELKAYNENELHIGNAMYRYPAGNLYVSINKTTYKPADNIRSMFGKEVEAFADGKGVVRFVRLYVSEEDAFIALFNGYEQKGLDNKKIKVTPLQADVSPKVYELSDKVRIDGAIGTLDDVMNTAQLVSYDALYKFTVNAKGEIVAIEKPGAFLDYKQGLNYSGLMPYESDDYLSLNGKRIYPSGVPVYLVGMEDEEYKILRYGSFSSLGNRSMDKGSFQFRFVSYEQPNKLDCVIIFGDIDKMYLAYTDTRALVTEKKEVYVDGELYIQIKFVTDSGVATEIQLEASETEKINQYQLYHYIQVNRGYVIGPNYQRNGTLDYDLSVPFDEVKTDDSAATGLRRGVIRSIDDKTVVFEDGTVYGDVYWRVPGAASIYRIDHSRNKVETIGMDELVAGDEVIYSSVANSVSAIFVK